MDSIRNILVILDPTAAADPQPAVQKAQRLASALRADVELIACETRALRELHQSRRLGGAPGPSIEDRLEQQRATLSRALAHQNLDVQSAVIRGDPLHERILAWLKDSPADLVVKDTHHHPLVRRTFLGNTDWHLIRDCPRPLLLTKPSPWGDPPALAAAVDPRGSGHEEEPLDRRILECAQMLSGALHTRPRVVHSYLPELILAAGVAGTALAASPLEVEAEQAMQRSRIEALLDQCKVAAAEVCVEMGAATEFLPRYAQTQHLDLLLMGARSRSQLGAAVIGSTAEQVLERLPCDVFIVRAPSLGKGLLF